VLDSFLPFFRAFFAIRVCSLFESCLLKPPPRRNGPRKRLGSRELLSFVCDGGLAQGLRAGQLLGFLQRFLCHLESSLNQLCPLGASSRGARDGPNPGVDSRTRPAASKALTDG